MATIRRRLAGLVRVARGVRAHLAGVVLLAGLGLALMVACNGVLGIPEVDLLTAGDSATTNQNPEGGGLTCAQGQKSCGGACVSISEPGNGCASVDCRPCALAHAKNACVQGECAIEACEQGFDNCNGSRADGCEADLRKDNDNCRECGMKCGDYACSGGVCLCTTNESCGFNGKCENKTCVCGGNTCSPGSDCDDTDSCRF